MEVVNQRKIFSAGALISCRPLNIERVQAWSAQKAQNSSRTRTATTIAIILNMDSSVVEWKLGPQFTRMTQRSVRSLLVNASENMPTVQICPKRSLRRSAGRGVR